MVARLVKAVFAPLETLSTKRRRVDVLPHRGRSVLDIHDAVAHARTSGQLTFYYHGGGQFEKVEWSTVEGDPEETA